MAEDAKDWAEFNRRMEAAGCDMRLKRRPVMTRTYELVMDDVLYPPEVPRPEGVTGRILELDRKADRLVVQWSDEEEPRTYGTRAPRNVWSRDRRDQEIFDWEQHLLHKWERHAAQKRSA